ncbi:MAG: ferritin-like domain-containing protein, partial [Planctomycetota bacterium]
AIERLNKGVQLCVEVSDHGTRQILETILKEEEHHIEWLETQKSLIEKLGIENYLTLKLGPTTSEH